MNVKEDRNVENVELCGWCGIALGSANLIGESVCVRCAELLINAGLSNKEIFNGKDKEEESSPPHLHKEDK